MIEVTPQHLLDCVALVYDDLLKRPDFMLEVMKANDFMVLIRFRSEGLERRRAHLHGGFKAEWAFEPRTQSRDLTTKPQRASAYSDVA
ncbi:hypothetical protein AVEN_262081-1 [Araneus ventricosus]|uniref:Uncharacterized protein n=1 Tax=Araneus ventricosus TaxID=182803 RepID=A0A4Y2RIQ9_ARAVE|nr:hypothetical protein AVEN_241692-1 [Araneus ventricosus]GBN75523.1 hypothetical protein AVEN_262081-1 [Araneus ventricosus]